MTSDDRKKTEKKEIYNYTQVADQESWRISFARQVVTIKLIFWYNCIFAYLLARLKQQSRYMNICICADQVVTTKGIQLDAPITCDSCRCSHCKDHNLHDFSGHLKTESTFLIEQQFTKFLFYHENICPRFEVFHTCKVQPDGLDIQGFCHRQPAPIHQDHHHCHSKVDQGAKHIVVDPSDWNIARVRS